MTLEAVLNRAGQMNRAERWTYGPRVDSTTLIRFREPRRAEASGRGIARDAGPPLVSADGVLWNPPCLPDERGV